MSLLSETPHALEASTAPASDPMRKRIEKLNQTHGEAPLCKGRRQLACWPGGAGSAEEARLLGQPGASCSTRRARSGGGIMQASVRPNSR